MQREYNLTHTIAQKTETFQHITPDYHQFKTNDGTTEINKVSSGVLLISVNSDLSSWNNGHLQVLTTSKKTFVVLQTR